MNIAKNFYNEVQCHHRLLKSLMWGALFSLPIILHGIGFYHKFQQQNLGFVQQHKPKSLIFMDEQIARLINQGKTFKELMHLGYSKQQIMAGFKELIVARSPIPTVEELKNLGFNEKQIINHTAGLIEQENLSVNDLDDMGFKDTKLMPKVINVLVNQYHFSQDELEGIGFTPNEINSLQAT